jgi:serine protease
MKTLFRNALLVVGLGVLITACGDTPTVTTPPAPTVQVNPSIKPTKASLPSFDGTTPRPLASVLDDKGNKADFVENELVISTTDLSQLNAFVARWQGIILKTLNPTAQELPGFIPMSLVKIKVSNADTSKLSSDLVTLQPNTTGTQQVSSEDGQRLMAVAARESVGGLKVGMNWVSSGSSFRDYNTKEAPTSPKLGYTDSAFDWDYMKLGGKQNIGVTEAWRALELAGKLQNKVKIAILDMGFVPNADFPAGWTATSNVPFRLPLGTENLLSCSEGNDCPWHGTNVAEAAAGVPENGFGAAGPAGPVADLVLVYTSYDFFTAIGALIQAEIGGAKIINMSFGASVPVYYAWTVYPFEAATALVRATGTLIFAAAGNDGIDIDSEYCLLTKCIEKTWYTPCENAGVICVGGIAENSLSRATNSNYGNKQVDIFAPFTVYVGPDPARPENTANEISGTSFSSPFAAGVAALIWAAKPSLSADEVEKVLLETANTSPDLTVKRYVNANAAVRKVLDATPPVLELTSLPSPLALNRITKLEARVEDLEDGQTCCTITWTSNKDGLLGTTAAGFSQLDHAFTTEGVRTITATATDSSGLSSTQSFDLGVINSPPLVSVSSPSDTLVVYQNSIYPFQAIAIDINEPNEQLACSGIVWKSSLATDNFPKTGCEPTVSFSSVGTRTLTIQATDPQGRTGEETVTINVQPEPINPPPNKVTISSPKANVDPGSAGIVTLAGSAEDPKGDPVTLEWFAAKQDLDTSNNPIESFGADIKLNPDATGKVNILTALGIECGYHVNIRITLAASDPQGNKQSTTVILKNLACAL